MKIRVRLFAGLAEAAGAPSVEFEWEGGMASELLARLGSLRPELSGRVGSCRVAVDMEFVPPSARIDPGRDVALIPPVSGG